ncbi:MAG: BamA/TamA family outer membrane protein, partial [Bacteroidota bacterium]|nr:BamA/TamA family outer membrane protein [Bacteroidota bacterium]
ESADTLANKILDCYILLTPQTLQSYTFDVEGTNSSGNYGFAGNLNYQHRNIFRGAELLNVRFKGALEKQLAVVNEAKQKFNTREYGVETDLVIPRFWAPLNAESFSKYSMPLTRLSLSYNYQKRPDYTRTIANSQFGYDWRTSAYSRHQFNLIDFNIVHLFAKNEAFVDSIKNLYIRSSYIDHLILATNYTYTYSTQNLQKRTDYSYFRLSFETAGNSLYLLNRLMNSKKEAQTDYDLSKNYYKFLNTPFAQYAKLDLEYRRGFILDYINSIVFRSFLGVALPYGNFDLIPFEKQYFTGGANGIRAWKVRSLGPGTYSAPNNVFPNQSSDIKLEANAEYRFKLFWKLEGALFLDAGNIWSINDKDNRPGAVFKFDQFYKQIAMGTGVGTRFDFTYFIIRVDLGIKMRDPAETVRTKWRIFDGPLKQDNLNLTFAIGYPF